jgi:hypothetical protein
VRYAEVAARDAFARELKTATEFEINRDEVIGDLAIWISRVE